MFDYIFNHETNSFNFILIALGAIVVSVVTIAIQKFINVYVGQALKNKQEKHKKLNQAYDDIQELQREKKSIEKLLEEITKNINQIKDEVFNIATLETKMSTLQMRFESINEKYMQHLKNEEEQKKQNEELIELKIRALAQKEISYTREQSEKKDREMQKQIDEIVIRQNRIEKLINK